jgi:hypothetical protein
VKFTLITLIGVVLGWFFYAKLGVDSFHVPFLGELAMAVALEQEMKAKAEEARANVIQAEAEVPKAMAEAFRSGNLGIMDYYRMKNIQADTSMRENIAKPETTFGNEPLSK